MALIVVKYPDGDGELHIDVNAEDKNFLQYTVRFNRRPEESVLNNFKRFVNELHFSGHPTFHPNSQLMVDRKPARNSGLFGVYHTRATRQKTGLRFIANQPTLNDAVKEANRLMLENPVGLYITMNPGELPET